MFLYGEACKLLICDGLAYFWVTQENFLHGPRNEGSESVKGRFNAQVGKISCLSVFYFGLGLFRLRIPMAVSIEVKWIGLLQL